MNLSKTLFLLLSCCVLGFASCDSPIASNSTENSDPVIKVDDSNVEMEEAIKTAQKTFGEFTKRWDTMPNDGASVKFGVPTSDDNLEHIWFKPTKITDTEITGVCGNDPAKVPGLKLGDTRTFKRTELSDWMILKGTDCYGGYTIRVLAKMDPDNAPPLNFVDF